jgi:hypothetical protein
MNAQTLYRESYTEILPLKGLLSLFGMATLLIFLGIMFEITQMLSVDLSDISKQIRGPASVPVAEVNVTYSEKRSWYDDAIIDDDSQTLTRTKNTLENWQKIEEFSKQWNLDSTGLYRVPSTEVRKDFIESSVKAYIDKRINGSIKRAKEGSALHTVGRVQSILKPSANFSLARNVKFVFKANVIQGQAILQLKNPYINNTTTVTDSGLVNIYLSKKIKPIDVSAKVSINANTGRYVASLERPVIVDNLTLTVNSEQSISGDIFSDDSTQSAYINYHIGF